MTHENWVGVLQQIDISGGGKAESFLPQAVSLANDKCWGTLSCSLIVDPVTQKMHQTVVDTAIADLRYGSVNVNLPTILGYAIMKMAWGGYPGATPQVTLGSLVAEVLKASISSWTCSMLLADLLSDRGMLLRHVKHVHKDMIRLCMYMSWFLHCQCHYGPIGVHHSCHLISCALMIFLWTACCRAYNLGTALPTTHCCTTTSRRECCMDPGGCPSHPSGHHITRMQTI